MQVHPGAPGTARQESTRTIVSTYDGGNATQPRAPGHERPRAASRAARHGRLSAATGAPGADVPPATTAGAPGQYRLSAAPRAPGHGRPLAAPRAAGHDRLSAATGAPGADVPPATTAGAPGQHRLSAAPVATVSSPAGKRRLRQVILPRVPATPNTLTYLHSHHTAETNRAAYRQASTYRHSRSTASSLRRKPQSSPRPAAGRRADAPSLPGKGPGDRSKLHHTWHYPCGFGLSGVRSKPHQVHPAIQVPPRPRSCSTAGTGFLLRYSRAPPTPTIPLPCQGGGRGQVRPTPLSTWWRGAGGEASRSPAAYRPCHCGGRFSWKAASPSCASAVAPTRSKIVVATFKRS